ncbi:MAG: hypothetical protein ACXVPQ_05310 [Bacteroidia bacterium]
MKRQKFYILILIFVTVYGFSQVPWETEANAFLKRYYATKLKNLNEGTLDSAVINTTQFILGASNNSSSAILSELYVARAQLRLEKWQRRQNGLNSNLNQSDDLYSMIEHDYKKATTYGIECECTSIGFLEDFYEESENEEKLKEVQARMKELGIVNELHTFLGLGVNYLAQKNILGVEMSILGTDPIRRKKTVNPATGKFYRPCGYDYPMSLGVLTIGYEASLSASMDPSKYNGVKLDAIWINYYVSLKPTQFLFCNSSTGNSFVWRPEVGYAFASFSISYAYNLPFRRSFTYLPPHNLSVHIIIPTLHMEKD